jgi:2,4-dienoyl-CoA reductase-like NADH-dependent reductase (Old Yellow Enzyme family)
VSSEVRATVLGDPLELPCGLVLPNRIVKTATGEGLADLWTSDVTPALVGLYERWAEGGTGTLITGGLSVRRGDNQATQAVLDGRTDTDAMHRWARAVHRHDVRLFGQLLHPGRQALVYVARRPAAPSALPPVLGSRMFGASRALQPEEIVDLIDRFAGAALMLQRAGFDGVELHAGFGFLIASFLSPATNRRTDRWGGDLQGRSRLLIETVRAVRQRVDPGFAVAVKLSIHDFVPGGFGIDEAAQVAAMLEAEGVDLIEVCGGTFESEATAGADLTGAPARSRQAVLAGLAPRLRAECRVPLALTGGLHSRDVMERLVSDGTVDLVGMARPLIRQPDFSRGLLDGSADSVDTTVGSTDESTAMLWWSSQLRRQARGVGFDATYSPRRAEVDAVLGMAAHVAATLRTRVREGACRTNRTRRADHPPAAPRRGHRG